MNRLLMAGLIGLVGLALIGGFLVVGGPQQARDERDDRDRARHLRDWGHHYACTLEVAGTLPRNCEGQGTPPKSTDPVTGDAYRFTRADADTFEICATFRSEAIQDGPEYSNRNLVFAGNEGCLRYRRTGAGAAWVLQ